MKFGKWTTPSTLLSTCSLQWWRMRINFDLRHYFPVVCCLSTSIQTICMLSLAFIIYFEFTVSLDLMDIFVIKYHYYQRFPDNFLELFELIDRNTNLRTPLTFNHELSALLFPSEPTISTFRRLASPTLLGLSEHEPDGETCDPPDTDSRRWRFLGMKDVKYLHQKFGCLMRDGMSFAPW